MRAMKLRFLILKIWNKIQPVPEPPPERKVIYALENTCFNHSRPITLEQTAPGVWICPECRRHAYVQKIRTQPITDVSQSKIDPVPMIRTQEMKAVKPTAPEDLFLIEDLGDVTEVRLKAV